MKKLLALVLIVCSLFALTSCGKKDYELAIGVAVTEPGANVKTSETVAAVIFDKDGKIVSCRIDAIDVDLQIDNNGQTVVKNYQTKAEKGDNYNMVTYGGAIAEWYVQAQAFETYVTGKTVAEVEGIDPTSKTLVAGCTIDMSEFVSAIVAAGKDAYKVAFKSSKVPTLGVSAVAAVADASSDTATAAKVTVDFAAVAMVKGKVVAATLDCADATVTYALGEAEEPADPAYECTKFAFKGTKRTLGDNYNMVTYGGAKAEWYAQAQAYADSAVGKTADEVSTLATKDVAGCTIDATAMQQALDKAAKYAR